MPFTGAVRGLQREYDGVFVGTADIENEGEAWKRAALGVRARPNILTARRIQEGLRDSREPSLGAPLITEIGRFLRSSGRLQQRG